MDSHSPADIRRFLMQFFDDQELTELCVDYFPEVNQEFTIGMAKGRKVQLLIDHCRQRGRTADLLGALERERSKLYEEHLSAAAGYASRVIDKSASKPRNPRQIFISHAHQDRPFAQQLADDLRVRGWQVWSALDSIRPGEKWVEAINRGLAESGIFVLVMTPQAVNSRWVQSETNVAIGLEHQGEMRLLPLEVEPVKPPPMWQAYQWIPFGDDYQTRLRQLFQELQPETMEQLARLFEQLKAAVEVGDWAMALSLGAQIEALYPEYRDVSSLVERANRELQFQQAKQAKLSGLYSEAQTAISAREWERAIDLADQIMAMDPAYRSAEQVVVQAKEGLRQEEREAELAQLYREMKASFDRNDWEKALDSGDKIQRLDENYRDVAELIAQVNEVLELQQKAELDQLYGEIQSAISAGRWNDVLRLGTKISDIDGSYRDVNQQVALARKNLQRRIRQPKDGETPTRSAAGEKPTGITSFWLSLKSRVPVWGWGILGLTTLSLLIWGLSGLVDGPEAAAPTVALKVEPTQYPTILTTIDDNVTPFPADAKTPVSSSNPVTYTVQVGDTFAQIAEQFAVTMEELAAANGLAPPYIIDVRQVLTIPISATLPPTGTPMPGERTYVVQPGNSYWSIATRFEVSIDALMSYNGLESGDYLEPGQVIRIPPEGWSP